MKLREELYPMITTDSPKASDVLENLRTSQSLVLPELDRAVFELDERIAEIEAFNQKSKSKYFNTGKFY